MADPGAYGRVFSFRPDLAYDHKSIERIQASRRKLGGLLFFDRLLQLLKVDQGGWHTSPARFVLLIASASQLYPPKSNQDLRNLHHKIASSAAPDHYKHSLLYYILLDCRAHGSPADRFAAEAYLPDKYATFIEGLWDLDHLHFQVGSSG